jgi:hypothetical protein
LVIFFVNGSLPHSRNGTSSGGGAQATFFKPLRGGNASRAKGLDAVAPAE